MDNKDSNFLYSCLDYVCLLILNIMLIGDIHIMLADYRTRLVFHRSNEGIIFVV